MNTTGITIQSFSFSWPQLSKETQTQEKDIKVPESIPRIKPKSTVNEIKPEELVMKPSPISFEERMNQVISPEQMKDLLSMMMRSRMSETDHKIDVKR
ncbi:MULTISPECIES: hypothetical protein [Leptospira]|uniref:Uncharacterized protein n=6 Tax=Leptospira santarosai TaxID=28183 RepID=A0AB73LU14_9LEPT|nr:MULTISPECIES: hypothetical protein [Leptospira]EMO57952.1 hypothetical protein LEP1GSC161_3828 [Leptospira santarosai str. CBC1416]ASV11628.1 hypothetical protein B2G51_07610 [Leptospira santarosai]AVV49614.1 Uncharacterized protein XB17_01014 [Leptospira santarosai]AVV80258.1 Uncharacterized protein XB15_02512 [Leptospira santarosai]EKO31967.1 hypothetical protein LEP1GSC179_0367 [Leptospira santarosai str. MOR084]